MTIVESLHREGINIRLCGVCWAHCKTAALSEALLAEMIARIIKNRIRARWRQDMGIFMNISQYREMMHALMQCYILLGTLIVPSDQKFKESAVDELNALVGKSEVTRPLFISLRLELC